MAISFTVNGERQISNKPTSTPLLWVLRDELELTGTKYGCGIIRCSACTVLINGVATKTCNTPASFATGKSITTIEIAPGKNELIDRLRAAWIQEQVPQCGYCQSGMIMAAAQLLLKTPKPSVSQIRSAMTNICACGTYPRVQRAIQVAAGLTPT